jgi:hypothetical protein
VVLELSPGDLAKDRLTEAQRAAAAGLHAQAMAGFLRWTAGKLPPIGEDLRYYVEQYRNFLSSSEGLQRSSSNLANLAAGFGFFLAFAQGAGAIAESEAEDLWAGVWASFREVDAGQTRHLIANDPVLRFFELLSAAITAGHAHLADPEGKAPEAPAAWGWREHPVRSGWETRDEWQPQGDRIGWVEGGDVFLEPDAAYAAAQKLGAQGGENLYVTLATLTKRIAERSLLATRDADRSRNTIRRTFEGRRVTVLHIFGEAFHLQECPMPAEVSQPSQVSPEPSARNSGGRPDRPKWPRDCPTGNRNGEETSSELGQLGHQDRPLESLEVSRPPQNSTAVPHVAQSPELQEPQDALSRKGEAPGLA